MFVQVVGSVFYETQCISRRDIVFTS